MRRDMDTIRIHENFSKGYYWQELLAPSLQDIGLQLRQFLLVVAIVPEYSYVGFLEVAHISADAASYGQWFSNYVKVHVSFQQDTKVSLKPVHFRREIDLWNTGTILLDNRAVRSCIERK